MYTFQRLQEQCHATKKYIADNECSKDFRNTVKENDVIFELVPPHQYKSNDAERAIGMFKNYVWHVWLHVIKTSQFVNGTD